MISYQKRNKWNGKGQVYNRQKGQDWFNYEKNYGNNLFGFEKNGAMGGVSGILQNAAEPKEKDCCLSNHLFSRLLDLQVVDSLAQKIKQFQQLVKRIWSQQMVK